jgi:hypothetical protein
MEREQQRAERGAQGVRPGTDGGGWDTLPVPGTLALSLGHPLSPGTWLALGTGVSHGMSLTHWDVLSLWDWDVPHQEGYQKKNSEPPRTNPQISTLIAQDSDKITGGVRHEAWWGTDFSDDHHNIPCK